jgi:hypothetical protein
VAASGQEARPACSDEPRGTSTSEPRSWAKGQERLAKEAQAARARLETSKATANTALAGLAAGAVFVALLSQAAGKAEFFALLTTLGLYALLTVVLPWAWKLGGIDVRLAVWLFEGHRRTHDRRKERGDPRGRVAYFRLTTPSKITPMGTASKAMQPYSLALTVGLIEWNSALSFVPGSAAITDVSPTVALGVALTAMVATVLVTWIVPPLWLLRTAGVRVFAREAGQVTRVDEWYNRVLGQVMGTAALGTFFIIFAIAGIGLRATIVSFATISIALFPINYAATYLYRARREGAAAAELARRLEALGIHVYAGVPEALDATKAP